MRSKLGVAVRKRFSQRMRQDLPFFREVKEATARGMQLYRWDAMPAVAFYLALQMHSNLDWFTLEAACTRRDRFPTDMPPQDPTAFGESGDCRFRLSELWTHPPRDVWWECVPRPPLEHAIEQYMNPPPVEDLLPLVDSLVEDAMDRVGKHAVPYFREMADSAGR